MDTRNYDELLIEIHADDTIHATLDTHYGSQRHAMGKVVDEQFLRKDIDQSILDLKSNELKDLERLGRNLYLAIFSGDIGNLFKQAITDVRTDRKTDKSRCLRIIIDVARESKIFGWPLEFLYCDLGYWLAIEKPMMSFSRRIISGDITVPPINQEYPPLNVLIVIGMPDEDVGEQIHSFLQKIGQIEDIKIKVLGKVKGIEPFIEGGINYDYLDQPSTCENIRNLLSISNSKEKEWKPHVFHFIGHGHFDTITSCSLDLDNACCSAEEIANLLSDNSPHLVFLQPPEGAWLGTETSFVKIVERLAQRGISAIVGMQFSSKHDYASAFSEALYQSLAKGEDVDAAVQSGRWTIKDKSRKEGQHQHNFGGPVLISYRLPRTDWSIVNTLRKPSKLDTSIDPTPPIGVLGESRNSVQENILKALRWLGKDGHFIDQEQAKVQIKLARNQLEHNDQYPIAFEILGEALECLEIESIDEQSLESARSMLKNALKHSEQVQPPRREPPSVTGDQKDQTLQRPSPKMEGLGTNQNKNPGETTIADCPKPGAGGIPSCQTPIPSSNKI